MIMHMLDLVFENHTSDRTWTEEFFNNIIGQALHHLKLGDKKVEMGLQLIGPEKSRELNNRYRQKDRPTDVLSFPLEDDTLKKYDILPLGDVFICLSVAKRQAEEMKIPIGQELARLAVHGLLHLLGYDHERSTAEEKKMLDLQEKIIQSLNP